MTGPDPLAGALESLVVRATGATAISGVALVQELWSGYGEIVRCRLEGGRHRSVVVKHVRWSQDRQHPRGWATDRSHQRKLRSYQVETSWYERYADRCAAACRVPRCLAAEHRGEEVYLVLEDLDDSGFDRRLHQLQDAELDACLAWLAGFHATFLGARPEGLWSTGTYWHLDTRPDELDAMAPGPLKDAASQLDQRLAHSRFLTFVHGDAKVANFCFSGDGRQVAAVDFQYVGGGCGMKDVAYFLSSCLDEDDCDRLAPALLDRYFELLGRALRAGGSTVDAEAVEADWRPLYAVAWADFTRFLQGWSPEHWKLHRYSQRLTAEALAAL